MRELCLSRFWLSCGSCGGAPNPAGGGADGTEAGALPMGACRAGSPLGGGTGARVPRGRRDDGSGGALDRVREGAVRVGRADRVRPRHGGVAATAPAQAGRPHGGAPADGKRAWGGARRHWTGGPFPFPPGCRRDVHVEGTRAAPRSRPRRRMETAFVTIAGAGEACACYALEADDTVSDGMATGCWRRSNWASCALRPVGYAKMHLDSRG